MLREKASIIFLRISARRVILFFSWITQEYLCIYPQITEFTPWKFQTPKIVLLGRNVQLILGSYDGNAV